MPSAGTIDLACRPEREAPIETSQHVNLSTSWENRTGIYEDKFILVMFNPLEHFEALAQLVIAHAV